MKSCQRDLPWFLIPSIFGKNSAAAAVAVAKSQSVERGTAVTVVGAWESGRASTT